VFLLFPVENTLEKGLSPEVILLLPKMGRDMRYGRSKMISAKASAGPVPPLIIMGCPPIRAQTMPHHAVAVVISTALIQLCVALAQMAPKAVVCREEG